VSEPAPLISRGDIWMLDWAPGRGSEQEAWRPGVIVQCDEGNRAPGARTTVLVALTTKGRPYLFYVPVPKGPPTGLRDNSWANCTQIITVDVADLRTRLGAVPASVLRNLGRALADVLGLPFAEDQ
jgi:mRNA interferase MazF